MKRVTVNEATGHFGMVIADARRGETTIVTDGTSAAAVVLSTGDYARFQDLLLEQEIRGQVTALDDGERAGSVTLSTSRDVVDFFEGLGAAS